MGRFITEVGSSLAALPEDDRPRMVTVLVMTDGHENASREWTKDGVRQLISQQEGTYNWDFVFLGANMDAVDVGTDLGFASGKSLTYAASSGGVAGTWDAVAVYQARPDYVTLQRQAAEHGPIARVFCKQVRCADRPQLARCSISDD